MRLVVESFKRLYESGRLSKDQLLDRVENKTLTREEYDYIVGTELEEV